MTPGAGFNRNITNVEQYVIEDKLRMIKTSLRNTSNRTLSFKKLNNNNNFI